MRSRAGSRRFRAVALGWVAGALLVAGAGAGTARGGEGSTRRAEAKAEVERAEVQYKLGRFDEALEGYSRAYELVNAPILLFDIGQCHRNLKSYERAIFFFQEYLREETRPDRRELANQLIAESRSELEKQRQQPPEPPEATPAGPGSVPTWREPPSGAEGESPLAPTSAGIQAAGAPAPVPLTRRWWFWTALGVGVAALAVGAIAIFGPVETVQPGGSVGTLDRRPPPMIVR